MIIGETTYKGIRISCDDDCLASEEEQERIMKNLSSIMSSVYTAKANKEDGSGKTA